MISSKHPKGIILYSRLLLTVLLLLLPVNIIYIGAEETSKAGTGETWKKTDDLLFVHHSVGNYWLDSGLDNELESKNYIDEINEIYYNDVVSNDSGRPKSLGSVPGDYTDMNHWIRWFNDYLNNTKKEDCTDGENRIIMFKSCYPNSEIYKNGTEPGDPFSSKRFLTNYKAVFRHYSGYYKNYTSNSYSYEPLERIFAANPDTLFIPVTFPPRHYAPKDPTNDQEGHRARVFTEWLKNDWVDSYNLRNPGLNNVAVFDFFDFLAYPDNHSSHPNRLKKEYGGDSGNSHPNSKANKEATKVFATNTDNFIDLAWRKFNGTASIHQWGAFGMDSKNSRRSQYGSDITSPNQRWNFSTSGDISSSPSISENGQITFGSDDGYIYSLHPNGTQRWRFKTGSSVRSSPAISNSGIIYCGSDDGKMYSIYPNGTQNWNYSTGSIIRSSPKIGINGLIHFGSDSDEIFTLFPNGTLYWKFETHGDVRSTAAIADNGSIIIGSDDGKLYSISSNGTQNWNFSTGSKIRSSPSITVNNTSVFGNNNGKIYCLAKNGTEIWNRSMDASVISSPASHKNGSVTFCSSTGNLRTYSYEGVEEMNITIGSNTTSSPSLDNASNIFIGDSSGYLHSFESNGSLRWKGKMADSINSSASIDSNGTIFIGTSDGYMLAVGIKIPNPPTDLTASVGNGFVNITWSEPTNDGGGEILHYRVYKSIDLGDYSLLDEISKLYLNDTNIQKGHEYYYRITANNSLGESDRRDLEIDLLPPIFGSDSSDTEAYTGDDFTFGIEILDSEDFDEVRVIYSIEGNESNVTMSGSYYNITIPSNAEDNLTYRFMASDDDGNINFTDIKNITIVDDDPPIFSENRTPSQGYTGDPLLFNITVTDNIGLENVWLNYSFQYDDPQSVKMNGIYKFNYTLIIPDDNNSDLSYHFSAKDLNGIWNITPESIITITDDDSPNITDLTPSNATTGDYFEFRVVVKDNIGIKSVYLNWTRDSLKYSNVSMKRSGNDWNHTIQIGSGDSNITYLITAIDLSGNSQTTGWKEVKIVDDDPPGFMDNSPDTATTGDTLTFTIMASDNTNISASYVNWSQGGSYKNESMTDKGDGNWTHKIDVLHDLTSVTYFITVSDSSDNTQTGPKRKVTVFDNDQPSLTDHTPKNATTGDTLTFKAETSDNIEVHEVYLEWIHEGSNKNVSMTNTGDDNWTYSIVVKDNLTSIKYRITVEDSSGNTYTCNNRSISVSDNDAPKLEDNTPDQTTTGGTLVFRVHVTDNIDVLRVYVNWSHAGPYKNESMTDDGSGNWTLSTIANHDLTPIKYRFTAVDSSGNTRSTANSSISVSDNDPPTITDHTPMTATTGDRLIFKVHAIDNVEISFVFLNWSQGVSYKNESMTDIGNGNWTYEITVDNSLTAITYFVTVSDSSGNTYSCENNSISISDNDPPIFTDYTPDKSTTGEELIFTVMVVDNIEVSTVYLNWSQGEFIVNRSINTRSDRNWTHSIKVNHDIKPIKYRFIAKDSSGNIQTTDSNVISIHDNDRPQILDHSQASGTTGDNYTFIIEATDNIEVKSVFINWSQGGPYQNVSLKKGDNWTYTIRIKHNLTSLSYRSTVFDSSGNHRTVPLAIVSIADNDEPSLIDHTSSTATTGDVFTFLVRPFDNIGISKVNIIWAQGTNYQNVSINGSGNRTHSIVVQHDLTDLNYQIYIEDTSGNSKWSDPVSVEVVDNDIPTIEYNLPEVATTGDSYDIILNVSDNIDVERVHFIWNHGSRGGAEDLDRLGINTYGTSIILDHSVSPLYLNVSVYDTSGNSNISVFENIEVIDNDLPSIDDLSTSQTTTGEILEFFINATDNIGIKEIMINWTQGSYYNGTIYLSGENGTWIGSISVPNITSDILYRVIASDDSQNVLISDYTNISVLDNDPPIMLSDDTVKNATCGEIILINITFHDNIGVNLVEFSMSGLIEDLKRIYPENNNLILPIELPLNMTGEVFYMILLNDHEGNTFESSLKSINVSDSTRPEIVSSIVPEFVINGESHIFSVVIQDNIGVYNVTMEYGIDELTSSMKGQQDFEIFIPIDATGEFFFRFIGEDESGNIVTGPIRKVDIVDETDPEIIDLDYMDEVAQGEEFSLIVEVNDNIGIDNIKVFFSYKGTVIKRISHKENRSLFVLLIPETWLGRLNFSVVIDDSSSNSIIENHSVIIKDIKPPIIILPTYFNVTSGEKFNITFEYYDNSGSCDVSISGEYVKIIDNYIIGKYSESGNYTITISAFDSSGNIETSELVIHVVDDEDIKVEEKSTYRFLDIFIIGLLFIFLLFVSFYFILSGYKKN